MAADWDHPATGTELAKRAWRSVTSAFRAMPVLYFLTFAIYAVLTAAELYLTQFNQQPLYSFGAALGHSGAYVAFVFLFAAPVFLKAPVIAAAAIPMHRFILLQTRTSGWALFTTASGIRFLFWALVLDFLVFLAALVEGGLLALIPSAWLFIRAGFLVVSAIVVANFILIFPAVAIEKSADGLVRDVEASQTLMRGQVWLFIRGAMLAALPVLLPLLLGLVLAGLGAWLVVMTVVARSPDAVIPYNTMAYIGLAVEQSMFFLVIIAQAAVASWLYAWLGRSPNPPSSVVSS